MPDPSIPSRAAAPESWPVISDADRHRISTDLLKGVSRTFYLTLRVLPEQMRVPVGLAYLLARAADTIADTRLLAPHERLRHLLAFREQLEGTPNVGVLSAIAGQLTGQDSGSREAILLESLAQLFSMLHTLSEDDRRRVRSIVVTLTRGMEMDLTRFPPEDPGRIGALEDPADLDQYIFYVAGCVGRFWTEMSMAHSHSLKRWDGDQMSELGVRFGKALQLTNVLRDVPKDLRIGRCYLPRCRLDLAGIAPEELLDPSSNARARPVLVEIMGTALEHYRAAEQYFYGIPRRCWRLRLAALWPVLIGLATLAEIAGNDAWLDPGKPSKVTRGWVYRMMVLSAPCVFSNGLTRAWTGRLFGRVEASLRRPAAES